MKRLKKWNMCLLLTVCVMGLAACGTNQNGQNGSGTTESTQESQNTGITEGTSGTGIEGTTNGGNNRNENTMGEDIEEGLDHLTDDTEETGNIR